MFFLLKVLKKVNANLFLKNKLLNLMCRFYKNEIPRHWSFTLVVNLIFNDLEKFQIGEHIPLIYIYQKNQFRKFRSIQLLFRLEYSMKFL